MILRIYTCWVLLLLGIDLANVFGQVVPQGLIPGGSPQPRQFPISPQVAAKIQQQHLQQLQQQHQQQSRTGAVPTPHHPSPPYRPPSVQPQQHKPIIQQVHAPKFLQRSNSLDDGRRPSFPQTKPRFSSHHSQPLAQKPQPIKVRPQPRPVGLPSKEEEEEDYYDDEEPDKLSLLLPKSKFDCVQKKDGYYADETLNCEVFHYCQEGKKHSWMCPENMNFHQVHLICMPPSQDNICTKSQNFHFVNEYLYRPINEKEAAATNGSLKYADRYYPQGYTPGMAIDELANEPVPYQPRPPHRFSSGQNQNVFYNPESVNIPLNQRRQSLLRQRHQETNSNEYYDE